MLHVEFLLLIDPEVIFFPEENLATSIWETKRPKSSHLRTFLSLVDIHIHDMSLTAYSLQLLEVT